MSDAKRLNAVRDVYRTFFEDGPEATYVSTVAGRFSWVNKRMERMLGYSARELTTIPVSDTYAVPTERRRFQHEIESAGVVRNFRLTFRTKSGADVHGFVDAVVWRRSDGAVGGYVGVIRREGRVVHEHSEEAAFALAMRGSNEGLWSLDLRENRMRFSTRWKALLGYGELEIHDSLKAWTSRIHPNDISGFRDALRGYLTGKKSLFSSYFRMKHRDESYHWMAARGIAEYDEKGKATRIAGSMSDVGAHISVIERLKRTEDQLSRENSRLAAEREMLSRYFPEAIIDEIGTRDGDLLDGYAGEASVLQILIPETDKLVSQLPPTTFQEFIDEVITDITDLVMGLGGSVNRISGDGLLATFGTPVATENDAERALSCALSVRSYTRTYNDVRPEYLADDLKLVCGVATGTIFSGSVGSNRRLDYIVHGQPIHRAAALVRAAAYSDHTVLTDKATARAVAGSFELEEDPSLGGYSLKR